MFLNLTLAQQMFFFFLALFLIQLVFCILVKLKLMPVIGNIIKITFYIHR